MLGTTVIVMQWMRAQANSVINNEEIDNVTYEIGFFCTWIAIVVFGTIKAFYMAKFVTRGTAALHEEMLNRLLKSPMLFYDTISVGSIINRFVIDLDECKSYTIQVFVLLNFKNVSI